MTCKYNRYCNFFACITINKHCIMINKRPGNQTLPKSDGRPWDVTRETILM